MKNFLTRLKQAGRNGRRKVMTQNREHFRAARLGQIKQEAQAGITF